MLEATPLAIPDVVLLRPARHHDARGWFSETWNLRTFAEAGIDAAFVQDNEVWSRAAGTLRGLHYQLPPAAQGKLVRAVRGRLYDVAVDLRDGSPTFGRHAACTLDAEAGEAVYVPAGFAHGYLTLGPDTLVQYKVTDYWAPECERGIRWDDPVLGIDWPVPVGGPAVGERDRNLPPLSAAERMPPS